MAEAGLNDLDALAVPDEERRVEVAKVVEPRRRDLGALYGCTPGLAEAVPPERFTGLVREHEPVRADRELAQVLRERLCDRRGQGHGPIAGIGS